MKTTRNGSMWESKKKYTTEKITRPQLSLNDRGDRGEDS